MTAILMLLIMFTALTVLVFAYTNYNLSAQEQAKIEQERSQEKTVLQRVVNKQSGLISRVNVTNLGTIEVKIRALYKILNGETTLICDPSEGFTLDMDTHIAPSKSLQIDLTSFSISSGAMIVAATERGTKSFEYEPFITEGYETELSDYDPTKLYMGPLMLKFDDFWYRKTDSNGNLDLNDVWHMGWNVTTEPNLYLAWNISVMNVGDRNISLNRFTGFNLVQTGSPSSLPWYLDPPDPVSYTQFLEINQTRTIVFKWDVPQGTSAQKLTFSDCTCMIFLTFFGVYHEADESTTAYAQTIPFEASVTIG